MPGRGDTEATVAHTSGNRNMIASAAVNDVVRDAGEAEALVATAAVPVAAGDGRR